MNWLTTAMFGLVWYGPSSSCFGEASRGVRPPSAASADTNWKPSAPIPRAAISIVSSWLHATHTAGAGADAA